MEQLHYLNENLQLGKWGHIAVLISFVAAILSAVAYSRSVNAGDEESQRSWKHIGRTAFRIHSIGVLSVVGILFAMILGHHFEYYYVWKHSSNDLPLRYVFSCFWEGQEGSFLLWVFWHMVLGNVLIHTAKTWEASTVAVLAGIQIVLVSMLLGIHFPIPEFLGDRLAVDGGVRSFIETNLFGLIETIRLGSSPFTTLLREHPDFASNPTLQLPNYLSVPGFDGNGLNPLLQNYWMTIHPPTLFLGFASTAIPFCFAIAGLWRGKLNEWMTPCIPWIFFGVMILGVGILMGGAWAYEALSFGGFWAWDPVENASLFPWLTLVGASHVMLIQKRKGNSSYMTIFLCLVTFLLTLYSTYLTRSGILGDTSVHSFADGMPGQLLFFLFAFMMLSFLLLMRGRKFRTGLLAVTALYWLSFYFIGNEVLVLVCYMVTIVVLLIGDYLEFYPKGQKGKEKEKQVKILGKQMTIKESEGEEDISSREFWMFIGAILLLLSCAQLVFYTSVPVWNQLGFFSSEKVIQNPEKFYSDWQMAFAVVISIVMGWGQFLKYKKSDTNQVLKKLAPSLIIAGVVTVIWVFTARVQALMYDIMVFSVTFAIVANADYWIRVLKGKVKVAGASVAHVGFGMILLGALISVSQQKIVSVDPMSPDRVGANGLNPRENLLINRGEKVKMGDYTIHYSNKRKEGHHTYFQVDYYKEGELAYTLEPRILQNERMGNSTEPDTRHFLHMDLYTHLQAAGDMDTITHDPEEYMEALDFELEPGDSILSNKKIFKFLGFKQTDTAKYSFEYDHGITAMMQIRYQEGDSIKVEEIDYLVKGNNVLAMPVSIDENATLLRFGEFLQDPVRCKFLIYQKYKIGLRDYILMKAIEFPMINILWFGCILFMVGTLIAMKRRIQLS